MNAQINGRRVSFSDRYLQDVKRDEFIEEQVKALKWLAPKKELTKALGKVYDIVHPPEAVGMNSEGD